MWKYVLPPVVVVAILWISMSSATTLYVEWLERGHQRVLVENFSSVIAADQLHHSALLIKNTWPDADSGREYFDQFWSVAKQELENDERSLRATIVTEAEVNILDQLSQTLMQLVKLTEERRKNWAEPDSQAPDQRGFESAEAAARLLGHIDSLALQMKRLNEDCIAEASERRTKVGRIVLVSRLTMLLTGPLVGIWTGWLLAKRLQSSMAQISVTLQQAESSDSRKIGTVILSSDGPLGDIRQQAEHVVNRLRVVLQELEQARNEIIRSERLAAVGEIAAGIAHEIRNPLTSVKLLLQHAARRPTVGTLTSSNLELILEEIGRVEATIQGLLDFSRPTDLRRIPHDLRGTLRRAANLVKGRADQNLIRIHESIPDEPLLVDGDPEQLHQVFANLHINAIEAMPTGGDLFVTALVDRERFLVSVEFRDTGIGIPDNLLCKLFEPFATSKERGTGLGLAISRRIIAQHEGSLTGLNGVEGGAVFTVKLPLMTTRPARSLDPGNPGAVTGITAVVV